MRHPEFTCIHCGSADLKRSRSTALADLPKMAWGQFPFRCLACKQRTWINLQLFKKGKEARCPRCLTLDVVQIPDDRVRGGLWKKLVMQCGAHAFRCAFCNQKFLSFKKGPFAATEPPLKPPTSTPTPPRAEMASAASTGK